MSAAATANQPAEDAAGESPVAPVLEIEDLSITYRSRGGDVNALRHVDLALRPGEVVGLAGESGSGKSTLALGAVRPLRPPAVITSGRVTYRGRRIGEGGFDVLAANAHELRTAALARDLDRLPERDERAQPGASDPRPAR